MFCVFTISALSSSLDRLCRCEILWYESEVHNDEGVVPVKGFPFSKYPKNYGCYMSTIPNVILKSIRNIICKDTKVYSFDSKVPIQ